METPDPVNPVRSGDRVKFVDNPGGLDELMVFEMRLEQDTTATRIVRGCWRTVATMQRSQFLTEDLEAD